MLTGKCKTDFEKWYKDKLSLNEEYSLLSEKVKEIYVNCEYDYFDTRDLSMQYGVYVDFFDSVGIHIMVMTDSACLECDEPYYKLFGYCFDIEYNTSRFQSDTHHFRQEAREQAILKANEIYNLKQ